MENSRARIRRGVRRPITAQDLLIKHHHEPWIIWEEFESDQRVLADNARAKLATMKAAVRCGRLLPLGLLHSVILALLQRHRQAGRLLSRRAGAPLEDNARCRSHDHRRLQAGSAAHNPSRQKTWTAGLHRAPRVIRAEDVAGFAAEKHPPPEQTFELQ